jgi:hypothetical protein
MVLGCVIVALMFPLRYTGAQQTLSLSVTPPLINLTISKGDTWNSVLKVVNSNKYDLTIYASVVGFVAEGEKGQGRFLPLDKNAIARGERTTLSSWISVPESGVTIPQEKSADIPITVSIPNDASPGGHYAAILIGTSPGMGSRSEGNESKVSSFVTTLLFVRIGGEVVESGDIREFTSGKTFYQKPEIPLSVLFENKGNVHVLPQGSVVIYNMWGKERGNISINQKTEFGSVLPGQSRRFDFTWKGEENLFEAGRYKAIVTLGYGQQGKKMVSSTTYFYIVPLVPVLSMVTISLLFIWFLVVAIRRYIRNALTLERQALGISDSASEVTFRKGSVRTFARPLVVGVMDLRTAHSVSSTDSPVSSMTRFVRKYKFFALFIGVCIIAGLAVALYFSNTLTAKRSFEVVVDRDNSSLVHSER